ncbi:hypothetical protein [Paenibacillus caui]|uniref:hypothetical protein n=1 Tax=Paenibacillus caui TaxID=2873927 RepID=UPI001CA9C8E3|nr:hypothetical protein [Paenibacillus caui]
MIVEKILPVKYPDLTCYPYYANALSIISASEADYTPWMLSNFIQLSCHFEPDTLKVDFFQPWISWVPYCCPLIDVQIINKDVIHNLYNFNIISFVEQTISSGYYIQMKVNHKFLSVSKSSYKQSDYAHELLIYGFNRVQETFEVADNFDGKYEFKRCSYKEFEEAYNHLALFNTDYYEKVLLLRPITETNFSFDLLRVTDSLKDYLAGRDTRIRDDQSQTWAGGLTLGIKIYEEIPKYLLMLLEGTAKNDIRLFHVLWEQKKLMAVRIKYMEGRGIINKKSIYEEYLELEKKCLIIRNLILKYDINHDQQIIHRVMREVEEFPKIESALLSELLDQIYHNTVRSESIVLGNKNDLKLNWSLI